MGSLTLALAGGVGGAGAGVADVARQDIMKAREEALIRLRESYESERQQTGIAAQKGLQKSGQEFEAGQTEKKLGAAARAHGATLAQEKELAAAKLKSEEKRTETTGKYRLAAAEVRANATKSGKGNTPIWELHNINVGQPLGPDGKPNLTAAPVQKAVLFNRSSGSLYAPVGGRLYRWDSDKNAPVIDPKTTNRAVDPGELQDLLSDPTGTIPEGFKNSGMSKADAFERAHGFLPSEFTQALQRAQQSSQNSSSASFSLPLGLVRGIGGPNATSSKVADLSPSQQAQEAEEDAEAAREDAEDNAPAQEPSAPSHADNDFSSVANQ